MNREDRQPIVNVSLHKDRIKIMNQNQQLQSLLWFPTGLLLISTLGRWSINQTKKGKRWF